MLGRIRALLILLTLILPGCGSAKTAVSPGEETMTLEGALGNRYVPAGAESAVVARIRIGSHAPTALQRGPVNVALVVDTSGSMEGRPIEDARAASLAMVGSLADRDRLSVIAFHSKTEVLLASTELDGSARKQAREAIEHMRAQGTTDLAGGLRAALSEVQKSFDPHGINRIVVLGDGVPNNPSGIRELAETAGAQAVPITVLGLGLDYDESLMGALAQRSGGQFHYVRESSEVASFFQGEVLRLKQVFARNATLDVVAGPGVQIAEVVGEPSAGLGQSAHVVLGDVSRTDTRDLVVKLRAGGHRDGAPVELIDAVLTYDDPLAPGTRVERRVFLGAHATSSKDDLTKGRNPDVEDTVATKEAAAKTLTAIEMVRNGENERAKAVLDQAAEEANRNAARSSNQALRAQADSIQNLGRAIAPSPAAAPFAGSGAGGAKAPPKPAAMPVIMRAHDEAMQQFQ